MADSEVRRFEAAVEEVDAIAVVTGRDVDGTGLGEGHVGRSARLVRQVAKPDELATKTSLLGDALGVELSLEIAGGT